MKRPAFLFPILLITFFCNAQDEVVVQHACNFSHEISNQTFPVSNASQQAVDIVNNILNVSEFPKNFDLVASDCEKVVATKIGNQRLILYNQSFIDEFYQSSERKWTVYLVMAHAIAHHLLGHDFKQKSIEKRINLELETDQFTGQILHRLGAMQDEIFVASDWMNTMSQGFNYPAANTRYGAIDNGWYAARAVGLAYKAAEDSQTASAPGSGSGKSNKTGKNRKNKSDKGKSTTSSKPDSGSGSDGLDPSMNNFLKARFPFPPPECHTAYEMPRSVFSESEDLGDVQRKISAALDAENYPHRFLSVPNGFAIVTQMEQYNGDGTIINDSGTRWVHYPKQEDFSWSIKYFNSLIFPKKGYLRMFVFIVTSEVYSSTDEVVSKDQAADWHKRGVNKLPAQVAGTPFTDDYTVNLLLYEFEVPESNHKAEQNCPCRYPAKEHLKLSGLKNGFF